jgi:replicative DNA helicase
MSDLDEPEWMAEQRRAAIEDRISRGPMDPSGPALELTRFVAGGAFVLDQPAGVPAVWGHDDKVLWAAGEPCLVVAPPGVGKTTLAGQLIAGRLGLLDAVLGFPVMATGGRVLLVASDRPRQIARALGRLLGDADRGHLDDRLVIWPGPPPQDLAKHPELLLRMCRHAGADTVVLDSLKDQALGLANDEVGSGLNRALQLAIAEDIEVLGLHHQRKGQNGTRPRTLEDTYGSTWITAGAGSVILLWGAAGDLVVDLVHLKQPAAEVGPLKIEHDHDTGISRVTRSFDPLAWLRHQHHPVTAVDCARAMTQKAKPIDNDRRKAARVLDRLVRDGHAHKDSPQPGGAGGSDSARYTATDTTQKEH